MKWHLVGYFPKRRLTRANWRSVYAAYPDAAFPAPEPVEEICSVSRCIAGGPDYGPDDAPNTAFDGYGSLDAARQAIGPELRREFDVFAYRLLSTLFRDGHAEEMDIPPLEVEPMPPIFEWLQRHGGIDDAEMHRVFNCGIGLVLIVGAADAATAESMLVAAGETVRRIGEIVERPAGAAATIVV